MQPLSYDDEPAAAASDRNTSSSRLLNDCDALVGTSYDVLFALSAGRQQHHSTAKQGRRCIWLRNRRRLEIKEGIAAKK
jgi:hypothetical protein